MKRVLIITYYWPPSGGSGVQRWLKNVRYLREFGWEPVVYTVSNGEYPVLDEALVAEVPQGVEVIKRPIWEPYQLYKRFTRQDTKQRVVSGFLQDKKPSLAGRISMWIRGNLFIPDARKFWIKPSVHFLKKWLRENNIDAIVSTGPPHSMHMIGMKAAAKTNIPWVADFRDPWTNIDFYRELKLSAWADRKHHRLEAEVLKRATRVVVVGKQMQDEYVQMAKRSVDVITNGYDEADLVTAPLLDTEFSVVHIGMLNQHRNHDAFWQAVSELCQESPAFRQDLKVKLIGKVDVAARDSISRFGLADKVEFTDYLSHGDAVKLQGRSQVLMLSINNTPNAKGVITGKLFEYLASRRPILCIGPTDGDAAAIIEDAHAGVTCGFQDTQGIKSTLRAYYERFQAGTLTVESSGIEKYSRRALAGKFAQIFDEISS